MISSNDVSRARKFKRAPAEQRFDEDSWRPFAGKTVQGVVKVVDACAGKTEMKSSGTLKQIGDARYRFGAVMSGPS